MVEDAVVVVVDFEGVGRALVRVGVERKRARVVVVLLPVRVDGMEGASGLTVVALVIIVRSIVEVCGSTVVSQRCAGIVDDDVRSESSVGSAERLPACLTFRSTIRRVELEPRHT